MATENQQNRLQETSQNTTATARNTNEHQDFPWEAMSGLLDEYVRTDTCVSAEKRDNESLRYVVKMEVTTPSASSGSSATHEMLPEMSPSSYSMSNDEYGSQFDQGRKQHSNPLDVVGPKGKRLSHPPLSLDVLAQVASATLATDHTISTKNQSIESLDLQQIQRLTDKTLVNLFASTSYNEIKRNYSLTCQLLPKTCSETFSSFGNETRAKSMVCQHLRRHLREIMGRKGDPDTPPFTAIPVPAITKMKRAYERSDRMKKRKNKQLVQLAAPSQKHALKQRLTSPRNSPTTSYTAPPTNNVKSERPRILTKPKDLLVVDKTNTVDVSTLLEKSVESASPRDVTAVEKNDESVASSAVHSDHNDHNYTTIYGKRYTETSGEVEEEPEVPKAEATASTSTATSLIRPYPPMPKYDASDTRILVDDEVLSSDDEKTPKTDVAGSSSKDVKKETREPQEWERKMALRCIRELRQRKKDEFMPLICKICLDRAFTAAATLTYHYRSHAGIKPYVCLICNTTFTRQHSLNYHMLIHNNQSRFSCPDCGRKFRHPSHFKEHMRRHTGETPFTCTDCPVRFKTRNTYKRHLRTRHAKLLTATGIHRLSNEEFKRVQTTKQYKLKNHPPPASTAQNLIVHLQGGEISGAKKPRGRKIKKYELISEMKIEELRQRQQSKDATTAPTSAPATSQTQTAPTTPAAPVLTRAQAMTLAEPGKFIILSGLNGQSILVQANSLFTGFQPQNAVGVMPVASGVQNNAATATATTHVVADQTGGSSYPVALFQNSFGLPETSSNNAAGLQGTTNPTYAALQNVVGGTTTNSLASQPTLPVTTQVVQHSQQAVAVTAAAAGQQPSSSSSGPSPSQHQQQGPITVLQNVQNESQTAWTLLLGGGGAQSKQLGPQIQSTGAINAVPFSVTLVPVANLQPTRNNNNNNNINNNINTSVQNAPVTQHQTTEQQLTSLLATLQNMVPMNQGQNVAGQ